MKAFSDLISSGQKFTLFVDHESMTNIKTGTDIAKTSAHTRTRNAYATIQNFENMTIKFSPGKHHLIELVDGISRCFLPTHKFDIQKYLELNHQKF